MSQIFERRGGERLANTVTPGHQDGGRVTLLSDGRFVITWRDASASGGDTSGTSIRGQLFNADGSKAGTEFLVNTATAGAQWHPKITSLPGGGFVIAWTDTSAAADGSGYSVKAQMFGADGTRSGAELLLNSSILNNQEFPSIAGLPDGGFVATWSDRVAFGTEVGIEIKLQRFGADGGRIGGEETVNPVAYGNQDHSVVKVLADGRYVVVWEQRVSTNPNDLTYAIHGQVFNADGTRSGNEIVIRAAHADAADYPDLAALAGGGFVVSWTDMEASGTGSTAPGVRAQVYDAAGAPVGGIIAVNQTTIGTQRDGFLAGLPGGGFVIGWHDTSGAGGDGSGAAAKLRYYDANGVAQGDEQLIPINLANGQFTTGIAADGDQIVVVWADLSGVGGDTSGAAIKFTRFVASTASDAADAVSGTDYEDTIHGLGGDDVLDGLGGKDLLRGGDGLDTLNGGAGADTLEGEAGDDLIDGGADNDLIDAGDGADTVNGGSGDDTAEGGTGADALSGGEGADTLNGGDNDDLLLGEDGNDTLDGGTGTDRLDGGMGADELDGGAGDDLIDGGEGDDLLFVTFTAGVTEVDVAHGGAGSDRLHIGFRQATGPVQLAAALVGDFATGYSGAYITGSGQRADFTGVETFSLAGGAYDDVLSGGDGLDRFYGGGGADRLTGGLGNDELDGEAGDDVMIGGLGDDTYWVDSAGDQVVEEADGGIDMVVATRSYILLPNFEWLMGSGTIGLSLTGNAVNNEINGTDQGDVIDGAAGADTMRGGFGNDIYYVDNAGDVLLDTGGLDEVRVTIATYVLGNQTGVEKVTGMLTTGQSLTGGWGANTMTGNSGDDVLNGLDGADAMIGGAGNDVYIIDNAGDTITETLGGGTDEVRFSLTRYTLPAHVEKGVSTATSNSVITGNALANEISGTAGWDTIDGGAGADRLVGGNGNDWYYVDNEGDVIVELNGYAGGSDTVETGLAYYVIPNGVELVNGTSATQTLIGNDADNWLTSNGGGDTLIGGKGNDLYQIKAGDIYIENAGEGVDMIRTDMSYFVLPEHFEEIQAVSWSIGQTLIGNAADNRIIGTLLNDRSDTIDGGLGADLMIGYHGSDIYYVDNMFDVVSEEAHHGTADEVRATLSTYTLAANVEKLTGFAGGRQSLAGNGLANTIVGGNGDDRIFGGPGPDVLSGGAGADRFVYTANAESTQTSLDTILDFEVGIDKIDLTALGPVQVTFTDNGMGGVSVTVQSGFTTIFMIRVNAAVTAADLVQNVLYGTAGDDPLSGTAASETIQGHAGNDQLSGGEGDDTLAGGAGNDSLDGGLGLDTLVGGLGDDIYLVDGSDTVFEHAGEGTDEVRTSRSYDLGAHVENLRATSDAGLALRGNEGANSIFGGGGIDRLEGLAGNDVLDGGGGADELLGGRGNDIYIVGSGDTVIEAAGEGVDEVRTALGSRSDPAAMYVLAANVEKLSGTSATGQGVHANALDNVVSMGGGGDLVVLDAGGNDLVSGGGGDDFLYWGATFTSADKADGGAGFDTVGLLGSYALVFDADDFVSVEKLAVYSSGNPAAPNSYSLTMHDGNVAAGQRMMVVAQSLQASEAFTFNGAAELDGSFNVRGGRGADTITGGAKADVLWGGLGADMLKGGGGADVFEYKAAAESTSAASDVILAFGAGDKINLSAIDADGNAANGNSKFAWLGDGAFTHQAGQLRVSRHADHASVWVAEADVDGDGTADLTILLVAAGDFLPTKGDFWL